MNFRVILLVGLVLIFTVSGVYLSVLSFETNSLMNAYNQGDVDITQNTTAGTVPHVIQVKNNGKKPVMVKVGQIMGSNSFQDMVVAEDKVVNQNSSSLIRAYCYEPNQIANPGEKLKPTGKASSEIKQIIKQSNLVNSQNTTRTQLEIWIIVSGDNINTTSGEASVLLEKEGLSKTEISGLLNETRSDLAKNLNITEGELKNLKPTSSFLDINAAVNGFIDLIKNAFNIS